MKPQNYSTPPDQSTSSTPCFQLPLRKQKFNPEKGLPSPLPLGKAASTGAPKMTCLCAPTTHAGSFRCRLHRASVKTPLQPIASDSQQSCADASRLPAGGNRSIGKVFSRLSSAEKRSKGETLLPRPSLRTKSLLKPSRLSQVTFARDIKEEDIVIPQPAMPSCVMQPKLSKHASSVQSDSSIRLMALRKCQSLMKEDVVLPIRSFVPEYPQPILSR